MKHVLNAIRKHKRFLLTTHAVPDGDGLGSEMALHRYFKAQGKKSFVINTHATPLKFDLVDPRNEITVFNGQRLPEVDAVLVVDTHDWKMLGALEKPLRSLGKPVYFLDHHVLDDDLEDLSHHFIDEQYGSTGELVYALLEALKAKITRDIAVPIYVSIITDTGSFRFNRTTAQSHRIAAQLLETGILPEEVFRRIYARDSLAKMRLFGHVLERVKSSEDNRIAWLVISRKVRDLYGATVEDTESFVNALTMIAGVDIGLLFREDEDGRVKVSLRGNRDIPVVSIAKKFGGGGHRSAAGIRMAKPLEEAVHLIYEDSKLLLKKIPATGSTPAKRAPKLRAKPRAKPRKGSK